jgi:peptidoglycan L-alanyl-D-glutamate endopeptidase CwlK
MGFKFGKRSLERLEGVHEDLVRVMKTAIDWSDEVDWCIIEGMRTVERQKELLAKGASTTMRSRHLTGHAIDMAPYVDGAIRWDWPLYHKIAPIIKEAADHEKVKIEWGGDWRKFPDGPHWQLPWKDYP